MKALIKSFLERMVATLSRLSTNGPASIRAATAFARACDDDRREICTPHGRITVRMGNPIEHWRGDTLLAKEPETIRWLDRTIDEHSVLFDVGANIGLYTLYALHLPMAPTARAVCFEPEPLNFARLNQNLYDNLLSERATAYCVGLGNMWEFDTFHLSRFEAGAALHGARFVSESNAAHRVGIAVASLDDFINNLTAKLVPTHLKIDVDGPELAILFGARDTLTRPELRHVLVEFDTAEREQGTAFLAEMGFVPVEEGAITDNMLNMIFEKQAAA